MAKLIIKTRYGVIPNHILNDSSLSLKAKGLFAYLQSKPNGWEFAGMRIKEDSSDGKASVFSALSELENAGFLRRKQFKDEKGHWDHEYMLSENRVTENRETENRVTENRETENRVTENRETENRVTENRESNKERNSKQELVRKNIERVYLLFKEKIQEGARLTPNAKAKIIARLKTFPVTDIQKAINNFSKTDWQMENNGTKGLAWFFRSDDKMEYYKNMKVEKTKVFNYSKKS